METWLDDAFLFFHDQSRMTELCNTRRSAGLPYLFCSIACADSATSRSKDLMKESFSHTKNLRIVSGVLDKCVVVVYSLSPKGPVK